MKTDCFRGIGSSLCVRANNTLWRTYFHFYSTVPTQAAIMNNLCQCSRRAYSHFYDTLLKPLILLALESHFCKQLAEYSENYQFSSYFLACKFMSHLIFIYMYSYSTVYFCLDFIRVPKLISWVVTLTFSGKTKEPECLDFKGFQAPKEQGMRESNSHQRFWRPLSYHLTNPLYTRKSGCWPQILLHCTLKTTYMLVDC